MPKRRVAVRKWMLPSQSVEGKGYVVTLWNTQELSCNCPAWVFKKGDIRTCLHVQGVAVALKCEQAFPFPAMEVAVKGPSSRMISLGEEV